MQEILYASSEPTIKLVKVTANNRILRTDRLRPIELHQRKTKFHKSSRPVSTLVIQRMTSTTEHEEKSMKVKCVRQKLKGDQTGCR